MENAAPSLSSYFADIFAPEVLADSKPGTFLEYRKAVRRFVIWTGLEIRLHDVDAFLIERWQRSMILEGLSYKTAKAWSIYVRRIVRHGVPGHCLKREGMRPHEDKPTTIRGLSEDDLRTPQRSLLKFAEDVYVPRRMMGCKTVSVNHIRWSLNRFAKYLGRAPLLDDCSNATMTTFMNWMLSVRKHRPATVNGTRKNIVALWNYANKRGMLKEQPNDCEKVKEPRDLPSAWTVEELSRIISSAKQQTTPQRLTYPPYVMFPAMILVAYDTGLRLSSLQGIRRADWRSDRREITARADVSKTSVAQTFVVSEQTAEAIHRMLTETHLELAPDELPEFLFPWNLRKEAIHEHFRSILKRAGVYCKGEDTFHKLRRTCATHLTAAVGIEAASRQLGHSSVQMTRRYVDVRLTGQHNAAEHLPRPE